MKIFKNEVGRPSNKILKKRRVFVCLIVGVVLLVVAGGIYYFGNFGSVLSTSISKTAGDKSKVGSVVYYNPVSGILCNNSNYWTQQNNKATCYRWNVVSENSDGSYYLLLDHNVDVQISYKGNSYSGEYPVGSISNVIKTLKETWKNASENSIDIKNVDLKMMNYSLKLDKKADTCSKMIKTSNSKIEDLKSSNKTVSYKGFSNLSLKFLTQNLILINDSKMIENQYWVSGGNNVYFASNGTINNNGESNKGVRPVIRLNGLNNIVDENEDNAGLIRKQKDCVDGKSCDYEKKTNGEYSSLRKVSSFDVRSKYVSASFTSAVINNQLHIFDFARMSGKSNEINNEKQVKVKKCETAEDDDEGYDDDEFQTITSYYANEFVHSGYVTDYVKENGNWKSTVLNNKKINMYGHGNDIAFDSKNNQLFIAGMSSTPKQSSSKKYYSNLPILDYKNGSISNYRFAKLYYPNGTSSFNGKITSVAYDSENDYLFVLYGSHVYMFKRTSKDSFVLKHLIDVSSVELIQGMGYSDGYLFLTVYAAKCYSGIYCSSYYQLHRHQEYGTSSVMVYNVKLKNDVPTNGFGKRVNMYSTSKANLTKVAGFNTNAHFEIESVSFSNDNMLLHFNSFNNKNTKKFTVLSVSKKELFHKVTYVVNGKRTTEKFAVGDAIIYNHEKPSMSGKSFEGWSDGTKTYSKYSTLVMGNNDVTLTAVFK